jgi:hypothetical protein
MFILDYATCCPNTLSNRNKNIVKVANYKTFTENTAKIIANNMEESYYFSSEIITF